MTVHTFVSIGVDMEHSRAMFRETGDPLNPFWEDFITLAHSGPVKLSWLPFGARIEATAMRVGCNWVVAWGSAKKVPG